jgi:guanylate kinase
MSSTDKGLLMVLSGPSGVGKGTLCQVLLQENPRLVRTTSMTTRAPREGEENGVDYHFVDVGRFEELKRQGAFLEWAKVHDNFYGTLAAEVEKLRQDEYDVIMEIDVQGAAKVRSAAAEGISVFILPPHMDELWQRITGRGTETEEVMKKRFATAQLELLEVFNYDYVVVNDSISRAVKDIERIMLAERRRVIRNRQFLADFIEKR